MCGATLVWNLMEPVDSRNYRILLSAVLKLWESYVHHKLLGGEKYVQNFQG